MSDDIVFSDGTNNVTIADYQYRTGSVVQRLQLQINGLSTEDKVSVLSFLENCVANNAKNISVSFGGESFSFPGNVYDLYANTDGNITLNFSEDESFMVQKETETPAA